MTTLSNNTVTETAIKMVIIDAIEKGNTNPAELAEYMKSKVFAGAVSNYKRMIEKEF